MAAKAPAITPRFWIGRRKKGEGRKGQKGRYQLPDPQGVSLEVLPEKCHLHLRSFLTAREADKCSLSAGNIVSWNKIRINLVRKKGIMEETVSATPLHQDPELVLYIRVRILSN